MESTYDGGSLGQSSSRRKFINTGLQAAAFGALLAVPGNSVAAGFLKREYIVQDIIDLVVKQFLYHFPMIR